MLNACYILLSTSLIFAGRSVILGTGRSKSHSVQIMMGKVQIIPKGFVRMGPKWLMLQNFLRS